MIKKALSILTVLLAIFSVSLAADAVVIDLSKKKIEIRYSFEGADIILFGTVGNTPIDPMTEPFDIVIVVRGPVSPAVVRQKEPFAGLVWVNQGAMEFKNAPGYYAVAANRPLADIAHANAYKASSIGFQHLSLELNKQNVEAQQIDQFQSALYRLRTQNGLYREELDSVTLVGEGLFRTDVRLPSNVPVGEFLVEAYVFQNGQLVAEDQIDLVVDKAGFERAVYNFAHETPFIYGVVAVLIALGSGWFAGVVGRK